MCEPPDGGVAEHVTQLALGLGAHGHEPVVLSGEAFVPRPGSRQGAIEHRRIGLTRVYGRPDAARRSSPSPASSAAGGSRSPTATPPRPA